MKLSSIVSALCFGAAASAKTTTTPCSREAFRSFNGETFVQVTPQYDLNFAAGNPIISCYEVLATENGITSDFYTCGSNSYGDTYTISYNPDNGGCLSVTMESKESLQFKKASRNAKEAVQNLNGVHTDFATLKNKLENAQNALMNLREPTEKLSNNRYKKEL
jgi:hypothetical protein